MRECTGEDCSADGMIRYVTVRDAKGLTFSGTDLELTWYTVLDSTASAMGQMYENMDTSSIAAASGPP